MDRRPHVACPVDREGVAQADIHLSELRRLLEEVGHVGDDDVDAQRCGVGKHHAAVDDDGRIAIFDHHEIHADLAEAA